VDLEVPQVLHKFLDNQEDQVVVDLGKAGKFQMLELVIHPQLVHLKEVPEE
jgi:hypothetical protein